MARRKGIGVRVAVGLINAAGEAAKQSIREAEKRRKAHERQVARDLKEMEREEKRLERERIADEKAEERRIKQQEKERLAGIKKSQQLTKKAEKKRIEKEKADAIEVFERRCAAREKARNNIVDTLLK